MKGACASLASLREISVLPTPVGPDHQDVLRQNLLAQLGHELLPAPAVAQRDGDSALGVVLSDNVRSSSETISRGVKNAVMKWRGFR